MLKSERDFYFYIAKSSLNEKTLIEKNCFREVDEVKNDHKITV